MNRSALAPQLYQTQKKAGEPYLQVKLSQQNSALLAMGNLQEVLVVPIERLTPIPNVPPCMLGLMNRRSRILWVIDLASLLQLKSTPVSVQQINIVTVQVGRTTLGLVVQGIEGTLRLTPEQIQSPLGQVSAGLVPYLQGCVLYPQKILFVLDAKAIANSSTLHNYYR